MKIAKTDVTLSYTQIANNIRYFVMHEIANNWRYFCAIVTFCNDYHLCCNYECLLKTCHILLRDFLPLFFHFSIFINMKSACFIIYYDALNVAAICPTVWYTHCTSCRQATSPNSTSLGHITTKMGKSRGGV